MSSDKQKSLAAMRTFARDVEREQGTTVDQKNSVPKPQKKTVFKEDKKKKAPAVKAKEVPQPKKIPPFHEVDTKKQKPIKTNIKAQSEKPKKEKRKDKKGIEPAKRVGGGTVITDNKKPKGSFFADAQKSLTKWFADIKKSLTPKKKNAYVVTKTERRKGVVQKATSKTGTIFSADSETVKEQIKARQRAEKREHEDDVSWSPYTETGFPLLEGEVAQSIDPRIEKVSVTPKTHAAPKPVIKQTEKIPELQEKVEVPDVEPLIEKAIAKEEAKKTAPKPIPKQVEQTPVEEVSVEPEPELTEIDDEEDEKNWDIRNIALNDTNTIAMLLVGIVLAIGIFGFVLFGIFNLGQKIEDGNAPVATENLYPNVSEVTPITLIEQTARELVNKANLALVENQNADIEYVFVNENQNKLAPSTLVNLLRTYTDDNFADVITNIRYVETANAGRALIIEVPAESIALGSMLNWEPTLFIDIGALLDVPNIPLNSGEFVDVQIDNLDVRVLIVNDETVLLYSVVEETKIIITDDITVLTAFLES